MSAFRAWWLRLMFGADTYPPEAAEAPARGESLTADADGYLRATPWIDGSHPKDCAGDCCYVAPLDDWDKAFDWTAAEQDVVRPWRGQAR